MQGLKDQVSQLLQSVDDLHRALNDERYNSSQLEDQLRELREAKAVAPNDTAAASTNATASRTEEEVAELAAELEESRASATRYAVAAESMSSQLAEATEKIEDLSSELESAQSALDRIGEYKLQIDDLEAALEEAQTAAAAQKSTEQEATHRAEEQLVALASRLAEKESATLELEEELKRQRELNHRIKEQLVEQAKEAEEAVAAEEAEQAELDAEKSKVAAMKQKIFHLESAIETMQQDLFSAVELATGREAEVQRLKIEIEAAGAAAAAGAAEFAEEQQNVLNEMEIALNAAREESIDLTKKLEVAEREITERGDREAALRQNIESLEKLQTTSTAKEESQEEISALTAARDAALRDVEDIRAQAAAAEAKTAELQATIEAAHAEIKAKSEELAAATAAVESTAQRSGDARTIEILQARIDASSMRTADLEGQLVEALDAIDGAEYKSRQLNDELAALTAKTEEIIKEKVKLEGQRDEAMAAAKDLRSQVESYSGAAAEVERAKETAAEAVAALEMAQGELTKLQETVEKLEREKIELEQRQTKTSAGESVTAVGEGTTVAEIAAMTATAEVSSAALKRAESEIESLHVELARLKSSGDELVADKEKIETERDTALARVEELQNQYQAQSAAMSMRSADLEGQLVDAYDTLNAAEFNIKEMSEDLGGLKAQLEEIKAQKASADAQRDEALALSQQLRAQMDSRKESSDEVQNANETAAAEAVAALETAHAQIAALQAIVDGLQRAQEEMENQKAALEVQVQEATERALAAEAGNADVGATAVEESRAETDALREQLETLLAQSDALVEGKVAAETQRDEALAAIEQLKNEIENSKLNASSEVNSALETSAEALAALGAAQVQVAALQADLESLQQEKLNFESHQVTLEAQIQEAYERAAAAEASAAVAAGAAAAAQATSMQQQQAEAEVEILREQLAALTAQSESIWAEKSRVEAQRDEAMSAAEQMQAAIEESQHTSAAEVESAMATAAEAVAAFETAQAQLSGLQAAMDGLQSERYELESQRVGLEAQVHEANERAAAAEADGADSAAAAAAAAQAAAIQQARGEADALREQLTASHLEVAALSNQLTELQAIVGAGGGPSAEQTESLQQEISTLHAAIAQYQLECQQYAERVHQLESTAAATNAALVAGGADSRSIQAALRRAEGAEAQIAQLQVETTALRKQVEAEKIRSAQLEAFAERTRAAKAVPVASPGGAPSQLGDKKDEDNALDMEAAALAGGSAFKPLVGVVRSLPGVLSHRYIVAGARELDRASVALDARPHVRLAIALYIILLHLMVF